MNRDKLRIQIRNMIIENEQKTTVTKAVKIGLDHLNKYRIHLSDGSVDYAEGKNIIITNSQQTDYKCSNINGIVKSESNLGYEFTGVNCDGYIWIDPKSLKLLD